jgi:hypothetical protein
MRKVIEAVCKVLDSSYDLDSCRQLIDGKFVVIWTINLTYTHV